MLNKDGEIGLGVKISDRLALENEAMFFVGMVYKYINEYRDPNFKYRWDECFVFLYKIIIDEAKIKGTTRISVKMGKDLINKCVAMYELADPVDKERSEKIISSAEESDSVLLRALARYDVSEVFDKRSYSYLFAMAKTDDERVFPDHDVDFFYQEFKTDFPDYHTSFMKMGLPERDITNPDMDGNKYQPAFLKVQELVSMKIAAKNVRLAMSGNTAAVNTYMRLNDKRIKMEYRDEDDDDLKKDIFQEESMEGVKEGVKKRAKEIKMEMPTDSPNWTPEKDAKKIEG